MFCIYRKNCNKILIHCERKKTNPTTFNDFATTDFSRSFSKANKFNNYISTFIYKYIIIKSEGLTSQRGRKTGCYVANWKWSNNERRKSIFIFYYIYGYKGQ